MNLPQLVSFSRYSATFKKLGTPHAQCIIHPSAWKVCSANFALSAFSENSSVFSPKNWLDGLQKDGHLADALASHPAIHFFTGQYDSRRE
jgi:hypothetical protein